MDLPPKVSKSKFVSDDSELDPFSPLTWLPFHAHHRQDPDMVGLL
jgi:hypothetical protein